MLNKKYTIGQYIIKMIKPKIFNIYLDKNLLFTIDDKFNDLNAIISTLLNIKPMFLDCHNDNSSIFLYINPDIDKLIKQKLSYHRKHSYVICNLDKIGYTDTINHTNIAKFINSQNLGLMLGYPPIAVKDFEYIISKPNQFKKDKIKVDYFGINFILLKIHYNEAMKFLRETYFIPEDFKLFCKSKSNYYKFLFNFQNDSLSQNNTIKTQSL